MVSFGRLRPLLMGGRGTASAAAALQPDGLKALVQSAAYFEEANILQVCQQLTQLCHLHALGQQLPASAA